MGSEGTAGRRTRTLRTLRAELALEALTADLDPRERLRRVLEQALVFASASLATLYTAEEDGDQLTLTESVGVPKALYGLRDAYSVTEAAPVADVHRSGEPLWLVRPPRAVSCA